MSVLFGAVPIGAIEGAELSKMTVAELRAVAKERGIEVPAKATKAKLLELIGA